MPVSYAILLKIHFWDDFARSQFKRLSSKVDPSKICILVDETNGPVGEIEHPWVVRLTTAETAKIGLASKAAWGHVFHFNVDYPLYYFFVKNEPLDYYVMMEHDVVANIDIDELVQKAAEEKVDVLLSTLRTPMRDWDYTRHHAWIYPEDELRGALHCFSLFSARAVEHLYSRRQELSRQELETPLPFWPFNEAFVPTEAARAGLKVRDFSEFYNMNRYDCWPPYYDEDVEDEVNGSIIHPVLTGDRYLNSSIVNEKKLFSYFSAGSPLRRRVERFPREERDPVFYREFRSRLIRTTARRLKSLTDFKYIGWKLKRIFS